MSDIASGHLAKLITRAAFWRAPAEMSPQGRTFRVGEIDAAHAGIPMCMGLHTVDIRDDAAAVLDQIAATDLSHRVGLLPQRVNRQWEIAAHPGQTLAHPPCRGHADNLEDTLRCLERMRAPAPVAVWQCGSYTCLYCDHGLGDVRMIQKLAALLTNPAVTPQWFMSEDDNTARPVSRALAHGLRSQPKRMARDLVEVARLTIQTARTKVTARQHRDEIAPESADVPESSSFSVAFVNGSLMTEFREHRDSHYPGVTLIAVIMHRTYGCFAAAGVVVADSVEVPIDCRRYLPPGVTTQGNFQALIRVPVPRGTSATDFAASLRDELRSFRPLLLLARWLLLIKLQMLVSRIRRQRPHEGLARSAPQPIALTLIDNTRWIDQAAIAWRPPEQSVIVGVVPAETENHVAIVFSTSGDGRLQVTATFDASRIDPGIVERSLKQAVVLASSEGLQEAAER